MYAKGQVVRQDPQQALRLTKKAAKQQNPEGEAVLGILYLDGVGISKDLTEAVKQLKKACPKRERQWAIYFGAPLRLRRRSG